jgi:DNA-binding response OmpR family regulator
MTDPIKKVAVVDDDYTTRTLISDFLTDRGFLVAAGAKPEEIDGQVEQCQAFIMDVMIGNNRYAGIDYIIEQRQRARIAPGTPVIFISNFGNDREEIQSRLLQAGKHDWLDKPIQFARLRHLLS